MADMWVDFGAYIDLSIEANRRKFIDENGDPVYLGATGSIPTGSAPDIFLSGDTATWHTNKGTGGGFTENGELTDALTIPRSQPQTALPQGCPNIGDVCDDGTIYVGLSSDGNVEMFAAPLETETFVPWNYGNATGGVQTSINSISGEANTNSLVMIDADSGVTGFQPHLAALYCYDLEFGGTGDWYLPAYGEYAVALPVLYVIGQTEAGAYDYHTSQENSDAPATAAEKIRLSTDGTTSAGWRAKDNALRIRCVRKGPAPRCQNPDRPNGTIVYNADNNAMQYCDPWSGGNGWRAIGQ